MACYLPLPPPTAEPQVIDMGVMVPCEAIIKAAQEHRVDVVGLSGLITPSLDEMVFVAREMAKAGLTTPLLIGGATTSRMHTAVKIAPQYFTTEHPVLHVLDASRAVVVVSSLLDADTERRSDYVGEQQDLYEELREEHYASLEDRKYLSLSAARGKALKVDWAAHAAKAGGAGRVPWVPKTPGITTVESQDLAELLPYIDWNPFFAV
jgi:5-methyltetrahydrofolate--homocysteine methyltransferase